MSRNDVIIGVAALVLVVFSLVVSIVIPRRDPDFPARRIGVFTVVAAALVVAMLASVEIFGETHEAEGHEGGESVPAETGEAEGGGGAQGDPAAGQEIFAANCGSCHTLEEAGTSGTIGPNLDESSLDFEAVVEQVTNGGGAMPAFEGTLTEEQIRDVSAFVVASQG